jgi:hypothetical protein
MAPISTMVQRDPSTHVEYEHAETKQQCDLNQHEHEPAAGQGKQEIAAPHGSANKTLQQLALAHVDQGKADAPHGGIHQVHAQQAGNEEIDVAGAGLGGSDGGSGYRVFAAGGVLESVIHLNAGEHAFGPGGVVTVLNFSPGFGLDHKIIFAQAEILQSLGLVKDHRANRAVLGRALDQSQRVSGTGAGHDSN